MHPNNSSALRERRFRIDGGGWAADAIRMPSPNFDQRADGMPVSLLVIHNISLPPGCFGGPYIADLFLNQLDYNADPYFEQLKPLRVSAHFLIRRDGEVVQFVSARDRAWHAGASTFCGRERCNDFSIGIELEGTDFAPFEAAQYASLAALTVALKAAYPLRDVTGHEHIAPGRKTDPGPFFEWPRYEANYRELLANGEKSGVSNAD
ncbi:MAG TPA: 1,6-anhydro-N-acetylmuramyl-L-alanine amidase AmpD, partial [Oxalicibacterium sp.]|nr:1,6-anhydro-N-acetylmuramyl-L-alanine amidase AmpD [Oxalicibacterium sp.]